MKQQLKLITASVFGALALGGLGLAGVAAPAAAASPGSQGVQHAAYMPVRSADQPSILSLPTDDTQICTTGYVCLDAWNDGPWVKDYAANAGSYGFFAVQAEYGVCGPGYDTTANCPYAGVPAGHFMFQIIYVGGGAWTNHCVGDAYNEPGNADTSLDPCGGDDGGGAGWGTIFWYDGRDGCPSGFGTYVSDHWHGRLHVNLPNYGNEWYENAYSGDCLREYPQVQPA